MKLTDHELALIASLKGFPESNAAKAHFKLTSTAFVLRYGFLYVPAPLKKGMRRGTSQQCFGNAADLSATRKKLIYCEGYAITKSRDPVRHAWVTDGSGKAFDNTWSNGVAYAGVPLKVEYVALCALKYEAFVSMIDDYEHDWPLLRDLADRPEEWLEESGAGRVRLMAYGS